MEVCTERMRADEPLRPRQRLSVINMVPCSNTQCIRMTGQLTIWYMSDISRPHLNLSILFTFIYHSVIRKIRFCTVKNDWLLTVFNSFLMFCILKTFLIRNRISRFCHLFDCIIKEALTGA